MDDKVYSDLKADLIESVATKLGPYENGEGKVAVAVLDETLPKTLDEVMEGYRVRPRMSGKNALVVGLTNDRSIAYGVVQALLDDGVNVVVATAPGLVAKAQKALPGILVHPCDVEKSDDDMLKLAEAIKLTWPEGFDYLVHAVAYSDTKELQGSILNMSRANCLTTMDISTYSLVAMCRIFGPQMREGGSVACFTFAASRYRSPNYNTMAPAKAGLESLVKYIAFDPMFGPRRITVNAISAGPVKTLSLMGVFGANLSLRMGEMRSVTGENLTNIEIGRSTVNIMISPGITAQTIDVDNGIAAIGMGAGDAELAFHQAYNNPKHWPVPEKG